MEILCLPAPNGVFQADQKKKKKLHFGQDKVDIWHYTLLHDSPSFAPISVKLAGK